MRYIKDIEKTLNEVQKNTSVRDISIKDIEDRKKEIEQYFINLPLRLKKYIAIRFNPNIDSFPYAYKGTPMGTFVDFEFDSKNNVRVVKIGREDCRYRAGRIPLKWFFINPTDVNRYDIEEEIYDNLLKFKKI